MTTTIRISLTVLALASCGRDTAPTKANREPATGHEATAAANQPSRKPCEYMSRADAEIAVGQPLPQTTENVTLGMCDYNSPEFYGASLTVGEWESVKAAATSGSPTHQPTKVSGVGDEALNLSGLLYVRKGDRGFLISLNGPHVDGLPDHGLERAKTLAQKILPLI